MDQWISPPFAQGVCIVQTMRYSVAEGVTIGVLSCHTGYEEMPAVEKQAGVEAAVAEPAVVKHIQYSTSDVACQ